MDSFPGEFTQTHRPLLFLAGLDPPPPPPTTPAPPHLPASTTPPGTAPAPSPQAPPPLNSIDPFTQLKLALAKTFASRKGFPLWDATRGANNDFHCILVDKNIRFPPLKARPTTAPTVQPPPPLHSPISPLTPTSPLYPDGIIAPIWIRKHRELVPSVFILVLRLFEHDRAKPLSPDEREDLEREKDAEIVAQIVERKRSTLERGIKLAVVLLCSRALLDDPSLDFRLSLIRRQSGLDSRASLFVISPVPQSEVNNFVQSIRAELYPAALDYYREHGRRVRRKRARQVPKGGLNEKGWNVRYDYKLALFSEMRSETEVSLKHYEDCYDALVDMFSTPSLLPPRTKRWAEAKVLADCVSIKISKLYLYLNEPSRALAQLNSHVYKFRELSASWQIGEETFEFWSWLSKQYRLFGDLTAVALRNGFRLPSLKPPPTPRAPPPGTPASAVISPGLMPLNVLQHAGFYYHLAAVCAVERRDRFRAITAALKKAGAAGGGEGGAGSPAVAHEMKVDHAEIIIELFTKAYEFFKANKAKNMTYYLASQIASAHLENGKHDMAFRFYDRISKNYRRKWREILDPILEASFRSAVKTEDWEEAVRVGFELLGPTSQIAVDPRARYSAEVLEILGTKSPLSPEKSSISLDSADSAPLLDCTLAFHSSSTTVSSLIPFQLVLSSPPSSRSSAITFSRLSIHFNDDRPPVVIEHSGESEEGEKVNLGNVTEEREGTKARLSWEDGERKVFTGVVALERELDLTVEKVVLTASIGAWTVNLTLRPDTTASESVWYVKDKAVSLAHSASICRILRRELRTSVETSFAGPAYLGEEFPVSVEVKNEDEVDVQVFLVIFLQPSDDGSDNRILVDSQSSTSVIESLSLGTLSPGTSLSKTFHLTSLGLPGPRNLDVTIRSIPTASSSPSSPSLNLAPSAVPSPAEVTRTLSIPTVQPLFASFDTQLFHSRRRVKPLLDLTEPDGWEGASDATVVARLVAQGPWDVEVTGLRLSCEDSLSLRVTESSLPTLDDAELNLTWRPRDAFNAIFRLDVKPLLYDQQPPATDAHIEVTWRRAGSSSFSTIRLPLPPIQPLPLLPSITLHLPPSLTLHNPTTLTYLFSNPTPRVVTLSSQLDSAEVPSAFVFAGARKLPEWILAPGEEREVRVRIVPLLVGEWAIPRLRVWEVQHPPPLPPTSSVVDPSRVDEHGRPVAPPPQQLPPPKLHELEVEIAIEAVEEPDLVQQGLEEDLRSAKGSDEVDGRSTAGRRAPVVLVLPQ